MAQAREPFYNSVIDFIRDKAEEGNRSRAIGVAEQILKTTGHLPIVSNIAQGAGYCSYFARLSEAVGVKKLWDQAVDRFSGKGSDAHRILGLASLYLFNGNPAEDRVSRCVDDAITVSRHLLRDEGGLDRTVIEPMLTNLVQNLDRLLLTIDSRLEDITPIVEQQFLDYGFHMRGVPDLILEDSKHQKAIVVDWKTGKQTPSKYEQAQVACYALMEGRRLALSRYDAITAVLGNFDGAQITDVRILPVIIRPPMRGGLMPPHPILRENEDDLQEKYDAFRKIVYDACIEAEHLTILTSNQIKLTGVALDLCGVDIPVDDGNMRRFNVTRLTPSQLWKGKPREQNNYPCVVGQGANAWHCPLSRSCRFYYGRGFAPRNDDYEGIMWKLRYGIYENKEKDLLAYRALQEIFDYYSKEEIAQVLRRGEGIRLAIGQVPFIDSTIGSRIQVVRGDDHMDFRVDILDKLEIDPNHPDAVLGVRTIKPYEMGLTRVINEGKPIMVTPVDAGDPLLSIALYGRVDDVEILDEQRLRYRIRTPSKVLNYQMMLFREYLRLRPELNRDLFVFQTNVDLTQMELNSIDALHERIGAEDTSENPDQQWREQLEQELQETNEVSSDADAESEERTIEQLLRDIVSKGSSGGSR